jgi:hypothetical protein
LTLGEQADHGAPVVDLEAKAGAIPIDELGAAGAGIGDRQAVSRLADRR